MGEVKKWHFLGSCEVVPFFCLESKWENHFVEQIVMFHCLP